MVNLFSWDDSLSTGVEDVDLQHKKLLLIIDDVRETSELTGTEYSLRMSKDLKRLTDYTLYHFTDEEALMKARGFPGIEGHKKEHEGFVERVRVEIASLPSAEPARGYQFYRFLGTWLLNHIAKSDRAWAEYIAKAGK